MFQRIVSVMLIVAALALSTGCLTPVLRTGYHGPAGSYNDKIHYTRLKDPTPAEVVFFGAEVAALNAALSAGRTQYPPEEGWLISPECAQYFDTTKYAHFNTSRLVTACERKMARRRIYDIEQQTRLQRKMERAIEQSYR